MVQTPAVITAFFGAMQAGKAEGERLLALFHPEAEYVEPFSGQPMTHRGTEAIRAAFEKGWEQPLPDMRIEVDQVRVDGGHVTAAWTCYSPALPGGSGSGVNEFDVREGLIHRLLTRFA